MSRTVSLGNNQFLLEEQCGDEAVSTGCLVVFFWPGILLRV